MTDKELVSLLKQDPETGMEKMVGQYTGLLWTVASRYLSEPEDVKDCVNDTFTEFFCYQDRFEPDKGSLRGYLAVIAKRLAVKRYWENKQSEAFEKGSADPAEDPFARLEQWDALEAALGELDPVDERIIRMKYYGGMTAKEIAASLGLPYETVKKRHQRSLKKLYKTLTVGLVVALLAALLAACAYVVLRYFGVIPGYGINTDPESAFYILESGGHAETTNYDLTVTDAWWSDGVLIVDTDVGYTEASLVPGLPVQIGGSEPELIPAAPQIGLEGLENVGQVSIIHQQKQSKMEESVRIMASAPLPEPLEERIEVTLVCDEVPVVITLKQAEGELSLDEAGYYSVTEEDGGLLAIPRLENGELIVSIYPLNAGEFRTDIGLTQGTWSGFGGTEAPVTVAAEDGTLLSGRPVGYSPFSGDAYLDWNFGPAEPGEYTLVVPYVYQSLAEPGTVYEREFCFDDSPTDLDVQIQVPGGTVSLGRLTPTEPVSAVTCGGDILMFPDEMYGDHSWWTLEAEWNAVSQERVLAAVPLSVSFAQTPALLENGWYPSVDAHLRTQAFADASGSAYIGLRDYVLHTNDPTQPVTLRLDPAGICYRWNREFRISFQVSE